ncbi:tRNA intron endonuclease, catalytic domain-like [Ostreococcus tauri]|uniref:tRNA-intron lyase n=1 Tax=Ostreococcus tauri TaxID=70448 RepID=A0A090M911_OSTTA|nr:tRNA intron endonuclease, catalytic domain-like [Ostreococcus tauri]CEF98619.1 tRNA intron endonuclease, catalytic domain-like [Ostreococcus tauri]|eukprot:XP_003080207.2 tRNA intron endonuclease, catalytic domain-like [Ostreococcus tauri]
MPEDAPELRIRAVAGRFYAHDARALAAVRRTNRIVGAAVGALPGYRSQDVARGLPVELAAEEVALCVARGWGVVTCERDVEAEAHADAVRERTCGKAAPSSGTGNGRARRRDDRAWGGGGGTRTKAEKKRRRGWERAVVDGEFVDVPLENAYDGEVGGVGEVGGATRAARERIAAFRDLHDAGFYMTSGAKFGSDYLAYPGDPMVFHAHYAVRVAAWESVIHPLALAASTRTAHAARKNFVVAAARAADTTAARFDARFFTLEADVDLSSNRGY